MARSLDISHIGNPESPMYPPWAEDMDEKAETIALFIANEVSMGSDPTPGMIEQARDLVFHLAINGWQIVPWTPPTSPSYGVPS